MSKQEQVRKLDEIAARCRSDEAFKQRLLADPMATLKAEGIELPAELSDDELNQVVGGGLFNDALNNAAKWILGIFGVRFKGS